MKSLTTPHQRPRIIPTTSGWKAVGFTFAPGDEAIELGDEVLVKYVSNGTVATVDRKLKLPPTKAEKQAEKIFDYLQSSRFEKWYADTGQFGCYVTGDYFGESKVVPTKQEILEHIKQQFLM